VSQELVPHLPRWSVALFTVNLVLLKRKIYAVRLVVDLEDLGANGEDNLGFFFLLLLIFLVGVVHVGHIDFILNAQLVAVELVLAGLAKSFLCLLRFLIRLLVVLLAVKILDDLLKHVDDVLCGGEELGGSPQVEVPHFKHAPLFAHLLAVLGVTELDASVDRSLFTGALLTISAFLLAVLVSFLLNDCLAVVEVGLDCGKSLRFAGEPWVGKALLDGKSLLGVECEHALKQALKLLGVDVLTLGLLVGGPEQISSLADQQAVVWVVGAGLTEGWSLGHHHEKDDTSCKYIDRSAIVGLAEVNFWCHVAGSAELGVQLA